MEQGPAPILPYNQLASSHLLINTRMYSLLSRGGEPPPSVTGLRKWPLLSPHPPQITILMTRCGKATLRACLGIRGSSAAGRA